MQVERLANVIINNFFCFPYFSILNVSDPSYNTHCHIYKKNSCNTSQCLLLWEIKLCDTVFLVSDCVEFVLKLGESAKKEKFH